MNIRLFIAIELGEREKRSLRELQDRMRPELPPLKWVKPQSIHLTLKFLGATDERILPEIKRILTMTASEYRPFDIALYGVGAFPSARRPRVLWVGVEDREGTAKLLAAELDRRLTPLGFEAGTRAFRPHLTIARAGKTAPSSGMGQALALFRNEEAGKMRVTRVSLVLSELTSRGAVYTPLHRAPLR